MGFIALATSPLPVVLAIFGGIAVLLAMIGSVEGNIVIKITPGRQRVLFAIGMVFIAAGLALYLLPRSLIRSHCQPLRPIPCRQPHLQRTRQKRPPVPQSQTRHEFNHQFRRFWFCLKMILVVV